MIVADTSIWVQFLRFPASSEGREMDSLLARNEIALTGVVLAEVLQGARSQRELSLLREALLALPYLADDRETWAKVAVMAFQLRQEGQAVPLTDLAVAAVALEHNCAVFALDEHFQRVPGLALHRAGQG